jgi:hypothetical protein
MSLREARGRRTQVSQSGSSSKRAWGGDGGTAFAIGAPVTTSTIIRTKARRQRRLCAMGHMVSTRGQPVRLQSVTASIEAVQSLERLEASTFSSSCK